jgi:HEAT repeat protein
MAALLLVCIGILSTLFPKTQDAASLIEKLRSDSFEEREEATRKLKALGKEARGALEEAAHHPDAEVAQRAKALLRLITTREKLTPNLMKVVPGLDERLAGEDRRMWARVLNERLADLRLTGPDLDVLAREGLETASLDPEHQELLVRFLERRVEMPGPAPDIREVLKTLDPSLPENRQLKAWALGAFGQREAIPEVVRLLEDPVLRVRQTALWACGKLRAHEAVGRLIELLREPVGPEPGANAPSETRRAYWDRYSVRFAAVEAAAMIGTTEAIPVLADLLKDEWAVIEKGTLTHLPRDLAGALGRLGAEGEALAILAPPARQAKTWVRHQAIWALSHLATPGARAVLVALLADPDPKIRISALGALGQHPMKEAAADVALRLNDPVPDVRVSALVTLRELGIQEFAETIARRIGDPDRAVRLLAAELLTEIGRREGVPVLLEQVADEKSLRPADLVRALDVLNGVRQPKLYTAFRETPYKGRGVGRPRDILEHIGLQMGLKLDVSADVEEEWKNGATIGFGGWVPEETLDTMFGRHTGRMAAFILESDRIRLLTLPQALAFWKGWWAEVQKAGK